LNDVGTESGVRLYLTELVSLSQVALQSQAWSMKAQAAATMADIGDKLKSNLGAPHLGLLLTTLLEGLTGRTWTGKASTIRFIATFYLKYLLCFLIEIFGFYFNPSEILYIIQVHLFTLTVLDGCYLMIHWHKLGHSVS